MNKQKRLRCRRVRKFKKQGIDLKIKIIKSGELYLIKNKGDYFDLFPISNDEKYQKFINDAIGEPWNE